MKSNFILLLSALAFLFASCEKNSHESQSRTSVPAFLLKGWILPIASNNVRTYDFTQMEAAGKRTVEIRAWQYIGTLGWQSNQLYSALFEATDKQVIITSATGYRETWDIISVEQTKMLIRLNGQEVYVFNCNEPGWPDLILSSMRGCR